MTYPYRDQRYYALSTWQDPQQQHQPQPQIQMHPAYPVQQSQYNGYRGYYPQPQQPVPFPVYANQPAYPTHGHGQQLPHTARPLPRPDRGRDYLTSLTTSVNNLHIQPATDKPLPRLPPPPLPATADVYDRQPIASSSTSHAAYRPAPVQNYADSIPPLPTPPAIPPRPTAQPCTPPKYAITASPIRKSFTPSFHPDYSGSQDELLRPPELTRPNSDSAIPTSASRSRKGNDRAGIREVCDLTIGSDSDSDDQLSPSKQYRRRAISDMPSSSPSKGATPRTPKMGRSPVKLPASPSSPNAVRCSGYTRSGQPCKRVVRSTAPYLLSRDLNIEEGEEGCHLKEERYCKDHAGRICQVGGFYWRGTRSVWIDFTDFIPDTLGQQTQTLLRTTMESRLTDKEVPGFLYAYELRDLQTPRVSFYKVGRTDNVPRRMSEWSSQCRSHSPTLRDIFPRRPPPKSAISRIANTSDLHRRTTGSYLPGAFHSGNNNDDSRPRVAAMKRWERLVHLELADLSSTDCPDEWKGVREKCGDCGSVHKEIFPIARTARDGDEYTKVVQVIGRWAAFVGKICAEDS